MHYKFKTSLQHSVNAVASLAAQDELVTVSSLSLTMGLSTAAEVNDYMKTRSYVEGYAFSAKDVEVFGKIGLPDQKQHPHAYRWYVHTAALSGSKCLALVAGGAGSKPTPAPAKAAAPKKAAPAKPAPAAAAEEEDDDDFWGDDEEQTEEEKAQAAKELEEAKAKAMAKLAKKEANQRSLCNLEIKPWEADQDLKALYVRRGVRLIKSAATTRRWRRHRRRDAIGAALLVFT